MPRTAAGHRMGGEDSGFIALELPGQPMTNLYILLLSGGTARAGLELAELRARFESRLDYLPALRWRCVPVPYGLHHAVWIDDPDFDIGRHLASASLRAPGGMAELQELCGRMAAEGVDHRTRTWDVTLVNGLEEGRQAIVWRAHHCLMDGAATVTTMARFFAEDDEDDELASVGRTHFRPSHPPEAREQIERALRDQLRSLRAVPSLVKRTRRALREKDEYERTAPAKVPRSPDDVPACSLNDAFRPGRRISTAELNLEDFRLVRKVGGVSFTDVALAVVAGALRTTLLASGDLPGRPLVAGCPVSGDPTAASRHWGNRFSSLYASLATDVEDPWERLAAISKVATVARRANEILGEDLWEGWLDLLPPAVSSAAVRHHYRRRRDNRDVANASITVSSVPGPASPWRLGPFEVDKVWLTGPPNNGVGAVVALFTYGGRVFVAANSVERSLSDPSAFMTELGAALAELVREAETRHV